MSLQKGFGAIPFCLPVLWHSDTHQLASGRRCCWFSRGRERAIKIKKDWVDDAFLWSLVSCSRLCGDHALVRAQKSGIIFRSFSWQNGNTKHASWWSTKDSCLPNPCMGFTRRQSQYHHTAIQPHSLYFPWFGLLILFSFALCNLLNSCYFLFCKSCVEVESLISNLRPTGIWMTDLRRNRLQSQEGNGTILKQLERLQGTSEKQWREDQTHQAKHWNFVAMLEGKHQGGVATTCHSKKGFRRFPTPSIGF